MSILSWFDNRTLLACHCILATVFAVVFLGMQRAYPTVRGLRSAAISFLLGIPGAFAFFFRGSIPTFISVVLGNLLILAACILVYDAIVQFTGGRRLTNYLWPLMIPVAAVLWYYSSIQHDIVPRILVMALSGACIRALAAWELLSRASLFSSRTAMRILGFFFLFQIATEIHRVVMTALHGAPQNYLVGDPVQTFTLAVSIFYICVSALCFLFMVSHELITRTRDESQQDALSGALNRRGIEAKLTIELNRINRSDQKLSIALIDIDHFKSINDTHGHAAGDTALRHVAQAISERLRAYDSLGRFGGDEFLLILPQTLCNDAVIVTSRLSQAVNSLTFVNMSKAITLSIGLTEAVPDDDASTLLARADKALYQAKSAGRNCGRVFLSGAEFDSESRTHGSRLRSAAKPGLLQQR